MNRASVGRRSRTGRTAAGGPGAHQDCDLTGNRHGSWSVEAGSADSDLRSGVAKRMLQVVFVFLFEAVVLFVAAGRLDWLWAWVFLGLNVAGIAVNAVIMLPHHAETVAERGKAAGMKSWDKVVAALWSLMQFVGLLVVAGLDVRFGWTGLLPWSLHLTGAGVFVLGFALFSWAMITNAYFAAVVRIQTERGQMVCDTGPYGWVRHPGYVGVILQSLGSPLLHGQPGRSCREVWPRWPWSPAQRWRIGRSMRSWPATGTTRGGSGIGWCRGSGDGVTTSSREAALGLV